ncbi:Alanine--tRNA ligase [Enhygromyxa salina]|uniref:Alanine--tRNA ligase n=1 Tax=Enhygromyxa salina TaxID=215803 RepID=A0A2S9XT29_9BACT|nr:alanine--tRNA ligase [Enhygromyxa salina]PRP95871.1 Alanine--tRNA ligase [Enhygromyxa salina]
MNSTTAEHGSTTTADAIRATFLDFFAARGHTVVPSASVIPAADPTLMFVNAGMVPFKNVFSGQEARPYTRATSSQKCIRISGKHNDLDNVGVTARHQTFFEMLGNFSFGDYFKEEAIHSAWELLTKVYEIPKDRIIISVFKGGDGFPADDEAAEIWRKITGFGDDRIVRLGLADNFWSMGDTGPCGPCSEIHVYQGNDLDVSSFGQEVTIDGVGWTELWNLVFMQFDRASKGAPVTELPSPCIDTGMGLERVACVLQGVMSNYDTDLLRPLVEKVATLSGKPYQSSRSHDDVAMRVIADHARATAFLIAEGVMPDKQKREYVLRRVMRRAIRHGHQLGIARPFLHEVAGEVVDRMGAVYPELVDRRGLIEHVVEDEEVRFRATLKRGVKILNERFAELRSRGEQTLPTSAAAELYSTYGFPLDLTEVISAESGFTVDVEGARAIVHEDHEGDGPIDPNAAVDSVYHQVNQAPASFIGYESEVGHSTVTAIVRVSVDAEGEAKPTLAAVERAGVGETIDLAVAQTPFYAESGGQVGDVGTIRAPGLRIAVTDTHTPLPGLILHRGVIEEGSVELGQELELAVDHASRAATRRNHSATHLLHWALREVLGEHASQKGSRVGPDVLRFDFTHSRRLTPEQITEIERLVNDKILADAPVATDVLPFDVAKQKGAQAIFEEKYGDTVRMVTMTPEVVELCGGTHVSALGQIGLFKILSEGGIAAGVGRIFAATGHNALRHVHEIEDELWRAKQAAKAEAGDLVRKIERMSERERELERKLAKLQRSLLEGSSAGGIDAILGRAREIDGIKVLGYRAPDGTESAALRELAEKLRDRLGGPAAVVLGSSADGKAKLVAVVSKAAVKRVRAGDVVKDVATIVGGRGGGRPDLAQAGGNDVARLDDAIAAVHDLVQQKIQA